ncbi:MAG: ParB/RepB/Spo0J family partition protein [Firmicutes bacterium]|nr:ParB/RepB/Spo0J family partition protein [Bacillota bacterium]
MPRAARHALQSTVSVWSIPVQEILPNPHQPRRSFDGQSIEALATSIRQLGLLQPIAVRAVDIARYELIAGERRLRACRQLGLTHIDALVLSVTEAGSALMALVENLQREDLHYLDEAEGYAAALKDCAMTQEALAARIGRSQSSIANKLRLLKLDPPVCEALRTSGLTERHARALLPLPLSALQLDAARRMAEQKLTVKQGEALVASMLAALPLPPPARRSVIALIRDHRLYVNAIRDIIRQMQAAGLHAEAEIKDRDAYVEIAVRVPKRPRGVQALSQTNEEHRKGG